MKQRISNFFANPRKVVKFNAVILGIGVVLNFCLQVFCIPVNWAIVVLAICFINSIFFPITIQQKKYLPIVSFLSGISFCLFVYCIIFLGRMNFIGLFLLVLGLPTFIPHYFAFQLFWKGFLKQSAKQGKWFFVMGIAVSLILPTVSTIKFQEAKVDIDNFKKSNFTELEKTYLTEKILGIGLV